MYANARGGQKRNVWLGGASEDGYDSSPIWGPGCLSGRGAFTDTGIILLLKLKFMLILAPCYILPAQLQGFLSKMKLLSGHTPP